MGGAKELIERLKYADGDMKKKLVLGAVAGVLFIVAGVFLVRAFMGPAPETVDSDIQQAATELREQLAGDEPEQAVEEDEEPFIRGGQPAPN